MLQERRLSPELKGASALTQRNRPVEFATSVSAEDLVFASIRRRRSLSPLCRVVHTVAAVAAFTATSCDKTFIFFMMNLPYIEVLPLLDLLGCDGLGVMSESLLKHKPLSCRMSCPRFRPCCLWIFFARWMTQTKD